ncbi:YbjN domain-containing protein [Actinomycetaceae bacterium WB03_NA08]|uniref:YbjN domain-containing protein n=1 Tax=Scrofimicrobium canadense TaxID=2652290 RepID=A0A6N7VVK7_9ACTO|nr:YbjN domain-containing protein [Scrofimicrobium canadense]MSS85020.1 YbjN domain-containing protein [Scrofimicrobium canadense]
MDLFQRPTGEALPLSQERLITVFKENDWRYFIDDEDDFGALWDGSTFFFLLRGDEQEILHIQSLWNREIDPERLDDVRIFIEEWHRTHFWPKCFYRIREDGKVRVFTENNIDWEHGVTDKQLQQQVTCAVASSRSFYDGLEAELAL